MQTMLTFPIMVLAILFTAILSSIITVAVPRMPKWYNALKNKIKRKPTQDIMDVYLISQLQAKVEELEAEVDNLARRLTNRQHNQTKIIRQEVRNYLEDLKNK